MCRRFAEQMRSLVAARGAGGTLGRWPSCPAPSRRRAARRGPRGPLRGHDRGPRHRAGGGHGAGPLGADPRPARARRRGDGDRPHVRAAGGLRGALPPCPGPGAAVPAGLPVVPAGGFAGRGPPRTRRAAGDRRDRAQPRRRRLGPLLPPGRARQPEPREPALPGQHPPRAGRQARSASGRPSGATARPCSRASRRASPTRSASTTRAWRHASSRSTTASTSSASSRGAGASRPASSAGGWASASSSCWPCSWAASGSARGCVR